MGRPRRGAHLGDLTHLLHEVVLDHPPSVRDHHVADPHVIVMNPPWDAFKADDKEFFLDYSEVVSKKTMSAT